MTPSVIALEGAGKRYGRRWALADCTLDIPAGHVVGLVGPNGAGKSTMLQLIAGLLDPTTGSIHVLGGRPGSDPGQLSRIGFLAQDSPVYARLTVAQHLTMGRYLNPRWDADYANQRIHLVTASGDRVGSGQVAAFIREHCPDLTPERLAATASGQIRPLAGPDSDPGRACLAQVGKAYHLVVSYQPAGRYWTFQWIEAGVFGGLALLAGAACYWWVTRRAG